MSYTVDDTYHRKLSQLDVPPRILLGIEPILRFECYLRESGPGPANAHPRVLQALSMRQVGHMDPKFMEIMNEVQDLLRYAFQTNNQTTIPISGCGSAAMESTFANLVEVGDIVLIFAAGYFAERMVDMAERYGANVVVCSKAWGSHFTNDEIYAALAAHSPTIVGIVHADTSTGVCQVII
jgi:alanine-glyoxylate transaminase/serine-glyoxylate transaminase/serine-pyruvate transaminase